MILMSFNLGASHGPTTWPELFELAGADTIRGRILFTCRYYSRKYGICTILDVYRSRTLHRLRISSDLSLLMYRPAAAFVRVCVHLPVLRQLCWCTVCTQWVKINFTVAMQQCRQLSIHCLHMLDRQLSVSWYANNGRLATYVAQHCIPVCLEWMLGYQNVKVWSCRQAMH